MFDFPSSPSIGQSYSPAGGQTYQWDGQAWVSTGLLATASMIERFYPVGVATWTKPPGLACLEFEGSAPGGTGAGALNGGASVWAFGASGGSGAWGKKFFQAADLPASVTVTVTAATAPASGAQVADSPDTTFGSLITLPGGKRGAQGANVTTSAAPQFAAGGTTTASPTGVDIGSPGVAGDYAMAGIVGQASTTYCLIGASGPSPYGTRTYQIISTGFGPLGAVGYGAGGSGACNVGAVAARAGGQGAPGFIRLREFYTQVRGVVLSPDAPVDDGEYVRINGVWRLKSQRVDLSGLAFATGAAVPVPTGARLMKFAWDVGKVDAGAYAPSIRLSVDGSTFLAGASDYAYTGNYFAHNGTAVAGLAPTASPHMILSVSQAQAGYSNKGQGMIRVSRPTTGIPFGGFAVGNAIQAVYYQNLYQFYMNSAAQTGVLAFKAVSVGAHGYSGTFLDGSAFDLEWVY